MSDKHGHGEERRPLHPRSPRQALQPERMPPPPSKRAKHPLVVAGNAILTVVMLLMIGVGTAIYIGNGKISEPGPLDRERAVVVKGGVREVADTLRREGVIQQPLLFVAAAIITGSTGQLKAGEYLFEKNASVREALDTIIEGKVIQHQVTLAEGLTSEQIVQRLMDAEVLTGEVKQIPREGTMLPDGYKVTRGTTREQLIVRMQAAHKRLLNEVWERRSPDIPFKSPEQLVTMASIVEKETGKADERTRVAAVFINRLARKMRLQSDPTIIYGLVGGKGSLGRPILREEIDRPTPYNTYTIEGLPPGPIANPGRASLEAVANPSRTKELYFVADGTGGHVFADTYDQHLKNVRQWREYQKEQATTARELQQAPAAQQPALETSPPPAQQAAPVKPAQEKEKTSAEKNSEKKAARERAATEKAEKRAAEREAAEKAAAEKASAEKKAPEKKEAQKKTSRTTLTEEEKNAIPDRALSAPKKSAGQKKNEDATPSIMSEPLPSADVDAPKQRTPIRQ